MSCRLLLDIGSSRSQTNVIDIMIEDLGGRVASVWSTLRPVTKQLLTGAMYPDPSSQSQPTQTKFFYDAHADIEVSSLLSAIDEQATSTEIRNDAEKRTEMSRLADTCVRLLEQSSASAEVFIQLATRALKENDYVWLDKLADQLADRYSASEIAEIVRQTEIAPIRAIAYETLAMLPTSTVEPLLDDPLYEEIGVAVLEQQAFEFGSDASREALDQHFGQFSDNN